MQEIVDQVQRLANRATVIALNVVVEGGATVALAEDLRGLAREVRAATDRTLELSRELDGEVRAAVGRMHELRGSVAARLEQAPAGTVMTELLPDPDALDRLLNRLRLVRARRRRS